MSETAITSFRLFIARVAAVFSIAALALFSGHPAARAQDAAGGEDEVVFDEEFVGDEGEFDFGAAEEEVAADEEVVAEADEGGFLDTIGDFFGDVKDVVVDTVADAYDTAMDFLGFGDEEEAAPEEAEIPAPIEQAAPSGGQVAPAIPEDTDVTAPVAAPKTNPFALRVSISAVDVAAILRSARGAEPTEYERRSFEIPGRGLVTVRASQDGPLFCLAFDLSEFRVAAALADASIEVNGTRNAAEEGGVNTACVGLPALSATAPLVIEAIFK